MPSTLAARQVLQQRSFIIRGAELKHSLVPSCPFSPAFCFLSAPAAASEGSFDTGRRVGPQGNACAERHHHLCRCVWWPCPLPITSFGSDRLGGGGRFPLRIPSLVLHLPLPGRLFAVVCCCCCCCRWWQWCCFFLVRRAGTDTEDGLVRFMPSGIAKRYTRW